jgi:hypothetical protein
VLYEDDHVRLLEVKVQPGETENLHVHRHASVFLYDAAQPKLRNQRADGQALQFERNYGGVESAVAGGKVPAPVLAALKRREADLPAAIAMGWPSAMPVGVDESPHQVVNLDTFPLHFYRFEFKRIEGDSILKRTSY